MKYNIEQLKQIENNLRFLIGNNVKFEKEYVTIVGIAIIAETGSLKFLLKEGLPHNIELFMWLESLIEYNPEFAKYLPK
jgi:hypothetical protein